MFQTFQKKKDSVKFPKKYTDLVILESLFDTFQIKFVCNFKTWFIVFITFCFLSRKRGIIFRRKKDTLDIIACVMIRRRRVTK